MIVRQFSEFSELEQYLDELAKLDSKALEESRLKPEDFAEGDYFISIRPDFDVVIFGKVVSPFLPRDQYEDDQEYEYEVEAEKGSRSRGYIFSKCYSVMCVDGELGHTHVSVINGKIEPSLFERARANGWRHGSAMN